MTDPVAGPGTEPQDSAADPDVPPTRKPSGHGTTLGSVSYPLMASSTSRRFPSAVIAAVVGVVAVGLIIVLAISSTSVGDENGSGSKRQAAIIGQVAPAITGSDLAGGSVDLDSFRGDWVLVNFFASWCPPCIQEHPELVRLSRDDGGPLQIISVGFQDSTRNVEKFFEGNGGNWPVLTGDTGSLGIEYGVVKLPESFLVSPFGRVVAKFEGGVTAELVESYINGSDAADPSGGSVPGDNGSAGSTRNGDGS